MTASQFAEKRQRALALLAAKGISSAAFNPPLIQLLGRLGLQIRPPHFLPFVAGVALFGVYFAVIWGLFMWLFVWSGETMTPVMGALSALAAGLLFGVGMAGWYRFSCWRHRLPRWASV